MPTHYDPQEHIQHVAVAPRAEGILDQREITIQSYRTTIPFDFARLNQGIDSAWLTPQIRFGVFARTPLTGDDALHFVLGLQDELSVRAYDYDARRPLWFTWQNVIVDTVGIRYFQDKDGFLVFKTTGGGRRITEDLLNDFNSSFLGIPTNAVQKRDFDLQKLRKLCFERFVDRLYMLRFADPSAEEYRSIEHALFQSRKWMDWEVERLHEIQDDPQVRIESFEADIEMHADDLAGLTTVRFVIRGLSGSLRLKFPKLEDKNEPKTIEEQARVFYRLVDVAEGTILDADYYTHQPRSLDELDVELGLFEDNVDLTQFREVLMNKDARREFFQSLDLSEMWHKWRPHLRALEELLPTAGVADHLAALAQEMIAQKPGQAAELLGVCQADAKTHQLGKFLAGVLADKLQAIPAESRGKVEAALLSWAVDHEKDSWDVDAGAGEILVYDLRWKTTDLSLDCLPAVLWKLVGVIHARLMAANGDAGKLLRQFDWCMKAAESLPPNHSKVPPALRLVAEGKVPISVADGGKVLKGRIADLAALDDAVLDQFGLPLWPCLVASRENGTVTIQNNGVGVARCVNAAPSETLFSAAEVSGEVDLCPGKTIQVPVTGSPATMGVRFTKFGAERHAQVPVVVVERPLGSGADGFDWATQAELCRATERVLGEDEAPDKGTVSKAIKARQIESNGKSGRACQVKVDSYKAWLVRIKKLDNEAVLQVMDAVTTEIRNRKQRNVKV